MKKKKPKNQVSVMVFLKKNTEVLILTTGTLKQIAYDNCEYVKIGFDTKYKLVLNRYTGKHAVVNRKIFTELCNSLSVDLESFLKDGSVILYSYEDYHNQMKKRAARNASKSKRIHGLYNPNPEFQTWVSDTKKELTRKSTVYESVVYYQLAKKIRWNIERQKPFYVNKHLYYPDIYVKKLNFIIEVDGGYHTTEEQKLKDLNRDADFLSIGIKTFRITNEDALNKSKLRKFIDMIVSECKPVVKAARTTTKATKSPPQQETQQP